MIAIEHLATLTEIEILIHHALWKETNIFCFKSLHIITVSRQRDLQRYFLPLAEDDRLGQRLSLLGTSWH